jgi:pSer/pThr/pTyr-binding forkhead associated (FHA) protein
MARLHYLLHDIAVPLGTFFIGRGADCQLALDDAMVSRRHAALRIYAGSAVIEDLGSRNGIFLNGVRIDRTEPVRDGDHIRIGSQDLTFYENDDAHPRSDRATKATRREMQLTELREDDVGEQTYVATGPMAATVRAASGLAIIGGVADKALALGRAEEAERILQRALTDILTRAMARRSVPPAEDGGPAARAPAGPGARGDSQPPASAGGEVDLELAERAAAYAMRLAAGTGHGAWIDYTFRLYTALGALLPARIVDELYAAVRKVKHTDRAVLRAYTTRLREISSGFGPAERFVLQRIEGFERWAP